MEPPPSFARRRRWLAVFMAASLIGVTALAVWDEERESAAALSDFAQEQSMLAAVAAAELSAHLDVVRRDALIAADDSVTGRRIASGVVEPYHSLQVRGRDEPVSAPAADPRSFLLSVPATDGRTVDVVVRARRLLSGLGPLVRAGAVVPFLVPPHQHRLHSPSAVVDGGRRILDALAARRRHILLGPAEAARLGLPKRLAVAGLARLDAGALGHWGVAVVASAARRRDRQIHARWRLVFGVLVAAGLVLMFGGYAMRGQRKELELTRELAIAEIERQRDAQLGHESRAATMVTLAAGVAHEVSTPLSVIAGRAEQLLERVRGDERNTRIAQVIVEQTARIESVVRGFLKLARGDTPTLQRVEPSDVVRGAVELVGHRFAKAGVNLTPAIATGLPRIRGDQRLLEHAIINLLLNACDACTRGGSVRITVAAEGGGVVFEVADDGAGISPESAARVLEPFFSTKPAGKGTGLGLAIASEMVKIHRGSLTLRPREPRGTCAVVRVPADAGGHDACA